MRKHKDFLRSHGIRLKTIMVEGYASNHVNTSFATFFMRNASVGNVLFQKKLPMITQDISRRSIAMSGESVSTYPRRPKEEASSNAVDVVEHLRDSTDQVPNAWHLHDLHTFSSMTFLEL